MPDNTLYIPHILPLTFRKMNPVDIPKYVSRAMDKYFFVDTIMDHQQPVRWYQPFQTSDTIKLQIKTKFGPVYLNKYNCYGVKVESVLFTQKQQDKYNPGVYLYEIDYSLAAIEPGIYSFTLGLGGGNDELYASEPIELKVKHDNSLLIAASNYMYRQGVYYETGIIPEVRVIGSLKYAPGSVTQGYEEQDHDTTIIDDVPFRTMTLRLHPIPDNFSDKLNRILGNSNLSIDGILYSKGEGSKLEAQNYNPKYPLTYWTIDLYESLNRAENVFEDEVQITGRAILVANISTKGFTKGSGDNFVVITNVE